MIKYYYVKIITKRNKTFVLFQYKGNMLFEEEVWFRNGLLHRENDPAIKRTQGYKMWYLNGVFIKRVY